MQIVWNYVCIADFLKSKPTRWTLSVVVTWSMVNTKSLPCIINLCMEKPSNSQHLQVSRFYAIYSSMFSRFKDNWITLKKSFGFQQTWFPCWLEAPLIIKTFKLCGGSSRYLINVKGKISKQRETSCEKICETWKMWICLLLTCPHYFTFPSPHGLV